MNNDFTPQEQALIERLKNAPQRQLSADAKVAMQQRILAQVGALPGPRPQLNIRRFSVPALAAAAVVAISLAGLVLAQYPRTSNPSSSPTALITGTSGPTPATSVPSSTPVVTLNPSLTVAFSLDGVIQAINDNVITINDSQVALAPNDPMLSTIHVGDTVHVDGSVDQTGKLVASEVQTATASVDGVVQSIQNSIVTINGIQVQLPANYPGLATIKVGTYLSINGYFRSNGTTVVLMVINVTVVPTAEIPTVENCPTAPPAMGMGDPGMGMAVPPAMGMGDPGMGNPAMGMAAPPAMGNCN
jgi:hypothetical protein